MLTGSRAQQGTTERSWSPAEPESRRVVKVELIATDTKSQGGVVPVIL